MLKIYSRRTQHILRIYSKYSIVLQMEPGPRAWGGWGGGWGAAPGPEPGSHVRHAVLYVCMLGTTTAGPKSLPSDRPKVFESLPGRAPRKAPQLCSTCLFVAYVFALCVASAWAPCLSWHTMDSWNIMMYLGISWNALEYHGMQWTIME